MDTFLLSRARSPTFSSPRQMFSHTTLSAHTGFSVWRKVSVSMWTYRAIISTTPLALRNRAVISLSVVTKAPATFLRWEGSFSRGS